VKGSKVDTDKGRVLHQLNPTYFDYNWTVRGVTMRNQSW